VHEDKTPEIIKDEIMSDLASDDAARRGGVWDTREGSFADDQVGPMAVKLSNAYASLDELRYIAWVDETSGPYIDLAADDMGIEPRKPGSKSQVMLLITGTAGYLILAGRPFLTGDDLYFLVKEDRRIPDEGEIVVPAEAAEIGKKYNVEPNSIIFQFDNSSDITAVTNPEAAEGGTDKESDASLYRRVELARKKPRTSGNKYDYEAWALEVNGVDKAQVFPLRYGRGTVMVLIADENRRPVSQTIVEECKVRIEDKMPIVGIELIVKTPTEVSVNISADIIPDGTETLLNIHDAFKSALEGYFHEISLVRQEVIYNQIAARLIAIAGVRDHVNLLLNGQPRNIALTEEQVPIVGKVVLT
jgi:uncharacterized phage protein gp47/JayE